MIVRIVKMEFIPERLQDFLEVFEASKEQIRGFDGCKRLELLQHEKEKNILFTYSFWETPEHLEVYRNSDLFKSTWAKTKILFSGKPEAWSTEQLVVIP